VGSASTGVRSDFAVFHGSRNRVWTFIKNTPPLLLWLTTPLHVAVTAGLLLLHWRRGDAGPVVRGIRAAFRARPRPDPGLAPRASRPAARPASWDILRAMAIDPVAFVGRRIVIRRYRPADRRSRLGKILDQPAHEGRAALHLADSTYSSGWWAWSIEPGPQITVEKPAPWNWPASAA
jgi:hypothetical protein